MEIQGSNFQDYIKFYPLSIVCILEFYSDKEGFGFKTHQFLEATYVEVDSHCSQGFCLFPPRRALKKT